MRKRIAYSQNFLRDKGLVTELVEKSSITNDDTVYEIGAGQGLITEQLLKRSKRVIAFEIDNNLFSKLKERFKNEKSLELIPGNFLDFRFFKPPYKVFSNIPFNITSAVIKKLTQTEKPPEDTYLIVQKEAAEKFMGKPDDNKNSLMAILLKPWFNFEILYQFQRSDFSPKPKVDTILLRIKKKEAPPVSYKHKRQYEDFIAYSYSQFKPDILEGLSDVLEKQTIIKLARDLGFPPRSKPSELEFKDWLGLFNFFNKLDHWHQNVIKGSSSKLLSQQEKLEKIHRTRVDKNWKSYS